MFDKSDEGTSVGLWVVIGIITLLLFGLVGGLGIRQAHKAGAVKAKPAAAAPAARQTDPPASGPVSQQASEPVSQQASAPDKH